MAVHFFRTSMNDIDTDYTLLFEEVSVSIHVRVRLGKAGLAVVVEGGDLTLKSMVQSAPVIPFPSC